MTPTRPRALEIATVRTPSPRRGLAKGLAVLSVLLLGTAAGVAAWADELSWLRALSLERESPALALWRVLTHLGEKAILLPLTATAALLSFRRPAIRRVALPLAGAIALASGTVWLSKRLIDRPRPPADLHSVAVHSPSMPSGHATLGAVWWGAVTLAALMGLPKRPAWHRWPVLGFSIAIGLLAGVSRPVLGVHYPSDVFAGWSLACAALALALQFTKV